MELSRSVGILTGASRGIGVHLARRLVSEGAALALAARSGKDLEGTAERIRAGGGRVITVECDVTKRADLERLVERTESELGPPDLLVNNAGIEHVINFERIEPDMIEAIIATNVVAAEILARLVVPGMIARRHGHIVNMSSLAGKTAYPYNSVYSSSKHALVGFSWSLREELKPHGVGVSVVCPAYISEVGMYVDWSGDQEPKGLVRRVSPEQVAQATIRAIRRDRAEVIVAKGPSKIVDVIHAISPALATGIARKSGLYRWIAGEASKRK